MKRSIPKRKFNIGDQVYVKPVDMYGKVTDISVAMSEYYYEVQGNFYTRFELKKV